MKKIKFVIILLGSIIGLLLPFLFLAFVKMSINFFEWTKNERAAVAFLALTLCIMLGWGAKLFITDEL